MIANNKTEIDNIFIDSFMPSAPEECTKCYLYGLFLASSGLKIDNTLENFAKKLNMSEDDVESAFRYWEEQGLVQVLSTRPIEVVFNPLSNVFSGTKLYKPEKYEVFNRQAQMLFEGKREITKTEYGEYYDFLERSHMQQEALIMIMKYCIDSKQRAVGYNYILTVARNWANEGVLTVPQVEERLCEMEENQSSLAQILSALGLKRNSFIEERALYQKWTKEFGFDDDAILFVAKSMKRKGGFERLDSLLEGFYNARKFSASEIKEHMLARESMKELAKQVNRNLGLFYESLDSEIESYISPWLGYGFEVDTILKVAEYAFKSSIRSLDGMDNLMKKLYKLGILTSESLLEYLGQLVKGDAQIKTVLEKLGLSRRVNSFDREMFKTWTEAWNMSEELIAHAASLSLGKLSPLQYMNRLLATWHEKGVKSVEESKAVLASPESMKGGKSFSDLTASNKQKEAMKILQQRKYSAELKAKTALVEALKDDEFKNIYNAFNEEKIALAKDEAFGKDHDKELLKSLKAQLSQRLKQLKLSSIEPVYSCKKCKDEGVVDGKYCDCFKKEYAKLMGGQELEQSAPATPESDENVQKLVMKIEEVQV